MKMTQRARRAAVAVVAAVAIGGSGVAVGAATAAPAPAAVSAPATSAPAISDAAAAGGDARASYADVVRQVLPSVVLISTGEGLGSGVVLDHSGNIVTNAHVAGDATTFKVQVPGDPAPRTASLVGSYPPDDLAVIRVSDPSGLQPARFADSAQAQAGDVVLAVGNPLGLSGSVTSGIISATGRVVAEPATDGRPGATLPDAIQTSAPINPGNSGGALVTTAGSGHRLRHPVQPGPRHRQAAHYGGHRDQLPPGRDRRPGRRRHRPGRHGGRDRDRDRHQRRPGRPGGPAPR
jgi:S1-C subfamily serine protease